MTILIATFTALTVIICAVSFYFFRGLQILMLPILFLTAFVTTVYSVNYTGYSVDYTLLGNQQFMLLSATQDGEVIYLVIRPVDEQEPRFVRIPRTEDNEALVKKAKEGGLLVLQFGGTGDSVDSDVPGDGGGNGINLIPLEDSGFGK